MAVTLLGPWNPRLADEQPVPGEAAAAGVIAPAPTEPAGPGSGEPGASAQPDPPTLADGASEPLGARQETAAADRGETAAPPAPSPAEAESALRLDRSARRLIQAGLMASGFDAGTADGLFGAGTRRALRKWQSARGVAATGYLDAAAAAALRSAAEDATRVVNQRQAELDAERRRPGRVFRDCDECPELVVMTGGDLALGRYEVTLGEYRAFAPAGAGDCSDHPQTDRHPATCVSWDDAQAYVSWLSRRTDARYRLPTESEWELAAVAISGRVLPRSHGGKRHLPRRLSRLKPGRLV